MREFDISESIPGFSCESGGRVLADGKGFGGFGEFLGVISTSRCVWGSVLVMRGCVIRFVRVERFLRLIGGLVWPGCLDLRCSE